MIRTRFMLAATVAALAAGCAGTPTTATAPVPDRQIAAAPTAIFTAADLEQMRKMLPARLTAEEAQKLVKVDPSQVKQPDRQTQVRRFGGFGRHFGFGGRGFGGLGFGGLGFGGLGFYPYSYGGLGLYWPYTWAGSYWNLWGGYPYSSWGGLYYPYGLGWGGIW